MNPIYKDTTEEIKRRVAMSPTVPGMAELERYAAQVVNERREALVMAWCAETGMLPSDSMIVTGIKGNNWCCWVERKVDLSKREYHHEYQGHWPREYDFPEPVRPVVTSEGDYRG